MFKKKKVKRSEWMEGLLLAEDKVRDGYTVFRNSSGWICLVRYIFNVTYYFTDKEGFHQGVIDYIEYKEKTNV